MLGPPTKHPAIRPLGPSPGMLAAPACRSTCEHRRIPDTVSCGIALASSLDWGWHRARELARLGRASHRGDRGLRRHRGHRQTDRLDAGTDTGCLRHRLQSRRRQSPIRILNGAFTGCATQPRRSAEGAGLDSGSPDGAQSAMPSIALPCRHEPQMISTKAPPVEPQLRSRNSTSMAECVGKSCR
jgi:hypothetical protein